VKIILNDIQQDVFIIKIYLVILCWTKLELMKNTVNQQIA